MTDYIAAAQTVVAVLQAAGAAAEAAPAVIDFVRGAVAAVEGRDIPGDEKLTAVLQGAELVLHQVLPAAAAIEHLLVEIAAFVRALVALYHTAGVFVHAAATALHVG